MKDTGYEQKHLLPAWTPQPHVSLVPQPLQDMPVHTPGIESVYTYISACQMGLWYPVPLLTPALPSVPHICGRSLRHAKTLLGSAMSLSLPSSHLHTPLLRPAQGSTREAPVSYANQQNSGRFAFSVCFGVCFEKKLRKVSSAVGFQRGFAC